MRLAELCSLLDHPVVILGGLDSILGAVVAGIIMGLIQQFASGYLDGHWGLNGTAAVLLLGVAWVAFQAGRSTDASAVPPDRLAESGVELHLVGDAVDPRGAGEAIREGFEVGARL